ncbi:GNAT family N-acetyltransferase [Acinetobacter gandensis]|uniref:GNAT family N-acetyltransferase n=1 Tax=Acinetobacter gandensis TaxID=1443941 RepID=UPI003F54FDBF
MSSMQIEHGTWQMLRHDAMPVREQVFIQEQHIAAKDEWDAEDAVSVHFVVRDETIVIATARLLRNNSIGRVAVLATHRGQGVGRILMQYIIQYAQQEHREFLKLSAQVHAIDFYANLGFVLEGEEYLDCGIPHIDMRMSLN